MKDPIAPFVNAAPDAVAELVKQVNQEDRDRALKALEAGGKFAISMLTGAKPDGQITLDLISPTGERTTLVTYAWEKPEVH